MMFGIGKLGTAGPSGSGGGPLPSYAYNAAAVAVFNAFTTPPTTRRKKTINWAINTLQGANYENANPWSALLGFWKVGQDQQSSFINWASPGTHTLAISGTGTPTFTANSQIAPATGTVLDTGIALNSLTMSNVGIFVHTKGSTTTSATDAGAIDASSNGLSICTVNSSTSTLTGRCGGANVTSGFGSHWSIEGIGGLSRTGGSTFTGYRGGVNRATITSASATVTSTQTVALLGINNNGTKTAAGRPATCWAICSRGLTDAEAKVLANVMYELDDEFTYGELDTYEAGYQPQNLNYDIIIYGATSQAVIAAYSAKRAGANVAIVGGYNDGIVGGMAGGGLGYTDWYKIAALGGLPLWLLNQIQTIQGSSSTTLTFQPRWFTDVQRGMLDPRVTGGLDIPVYWSGGVSTVTTSGAQITGFTTADGRTFTAAVFEDWSYEADLARLSGVPMVIGRESSAQYSETGAGYRGLSTSLQGSNNQYQDGNAALINVNPYVNPSDPNSGYISGVRSAYNSSIAIGSADDRVQAYNFRLTTTPNSQTEFVPFPSSAPPGYSAANYEGLGRQFVTATPVGLTQIIFSNVVNGSVYDWNNSPTSGQSLDLIGGSQNYPSSSYAARKVIWQQHWNYILGLIWYLQYDPDSRIPSAVRTAALTWGFQARHYTRPARSTDDFQWSPQLYVRESYRLSNNFMLNENDLTAADGTTPRSIKTVGTVSYMIDSHHNQGLADPNSGTPRVWNEGNINIPSGGTDEISPLPIEAFLPNKTDMTNLVVGWAAGATHLGFGGYRLEFAAMTVAQSMGIAGALAISDGVALQDIDYTALRTAILASPSLSGEVAPVLPQVN